MNDLNGSTGKGYVYFGNLYNGLIIQIGQSTTYMNGSSNLADVYFPISFRSNYRLVTSHLGTGSATVIEVYTYHSITNTKLLIQSQPAGIFQGGWIGTWIAIGY